MTEEGGNALTGEYIRQIAADPLFEPSELNEIANLLGLTQRQLQVLGLLIAGHGDQSIASNLEITTPTVRSHLQTLFRYFGVTDRTGLVVAIFKVYRTKIEAFDDINE